jgi:hypothetical protein
MNMRASRKGLSPLLAIIIGLVVTIVAGILLAQLYFSYAATISARPAANIEYVDLVRTSGGGAILALNIKNIGNQPISSVSVKSSTGSSPTCDTDGTALPGGVIGVSCSISSLTGNVWNGTVSVTFADGSAQVYAISVRARSA